MVTINTPNASEINLSFPYPIEEILNKTTEGDFAYLFTKVNSEMSFLPTRLMMFGLFVVFYGLLNKVRPNLSKMRCVAVAGLLTALGVAVLSFANLIPLADTLLFIVISVIALFIDRR